MKRKPITVVQIAMTSFDRDVYSEYLDDKGRVWNLVSEIVPGSDRTGRREYRYIWKQVEMPEEPEDEA